MKFLEAVAARYAGRKSLERTCFVFPNRRSGTFFKRYLGIRAGKPVFVPNVLTIDQLFARIDGREETREKARLLNILHQEYIRLMPRPEGTEPESFDQFLFWGDMLLNDFDDIDKYRVDAKRLLVNLKDYKTISTDYDFLSPKQREAIEALSIKTFSDSFFAGLPEGEQCVDNLPADSSRRKFARLWNILFDLYTDFRERLGREGLAYAGMIYRSVADRLPGESPLLPQYETFVFVGLNALNECEKRLLDHLRDAGRAEFHWDFFGPMLTDDANPAGHFMRENLSRYPSSFIPDCPAIDPKDQHFEVIRFPSAVGQTRKAMQILEQLSENGRMVEPEETAVILPDESLLFPMLGAVPAAVSHVNVTMGYSLSASSGVSLFQLLERLQQNKRQRGGSWCFYHRDVVELIDHPYFAAAADAQVSEMVKKDIVLKEKRIFVEAGLLAQGEVFDMVFQPVESTSAIPDYLKQIINQLQEKQTPVEREFLSHFHQAVVSLEGVGLDLDALLPRTWYRLLAQYIALVKIPFEGEPLEGLQVMGPLETRTLDFRNVIILSMNEGTFPSRSISSSFIPFILRKGFGLPTYEQQDAMAAYYFYRSICRAERIYLLYDSRTEGLHVGEESRYIKQLKYLYGVSVKEQVATYELKGDSETPVPAVTKDAAILEKMEERFFRQGKAFSASSLNVYLKCPLCFYYQYVAGIKVQEEVTEEMDANDFGTIYHAVMQKVYEPYKGEVITADLLHAIRKNKARIDRYTEEAFKENFIQEIKGEDLIRKEIIKHLVRRTLEVDAALAPFDLLDLEMEAYGKLQLSDNPSVDRSVNLYGKIDRMDRQDGRVRIIDYKTGTKKENKLERNIEALFSRMNPKRASISFQLYFYQLMMDQKRPGGHFHPCIYWVRNLFPDALPVAEEISSEALASFHSQLVELVKELYNAEIPFEATSDSTVCSHCDFKKLCNRR